MKKKIFKKIALVIFLIIVVPVLFINVVIMINSITNRDEVPGFFGYKPMIVMTGSMENTIMTGDLVIDKDYTNQKIKVGDIISFRDTVSTVITHRVVKIKTVNGKFRYYTKGDNNNNNDKSYVKKSQIEGIYISRIPKLGSFLNFIQTPVGIIIVLLVIFVIGLLILMISEKKYDYELRKEFEEYKKSKEKKE